MADFSTYGVAYALASSADTAVALNSYAFFQHNHIYSLSGVIGSYNYTPSYTPTRIYGGGADVSFPNTFYAELVGAGLSVATGPFYITGGTVSGFSVGGHTGVGSFGQNFSVDASGFSISATTFWNLTVSSQWHALWLLASAGDDTMTGSNVAANPDFIEGGAGSDMIHARDGNDSLWGNDGRDFLYGGDGNDVVVCNDWAAGGASALWSEGHGDAGDDYIFTGGYGSGFLNGGAGVDRMWGGPQQDFLNGGAGIDYMAGGAGLDVFEVSAAGNLAGEYDFILDFVDGVDFIKLPVGAAWNIADSAYGAIISNPLTGFYLIVQYATAAAVSDQIYYA